MDMAYRETYRMAAMAACLSLLAACQEPNEPKPAAVEVAATSPEPAATQQPAAAQPQAEAIDLLANPAPSQLCNVEFIDGVAFGPSVMPTTGRFVIRGWLGDASGARPVQATLVLARAGDGAKTLVPISLEVERPDVVTAFPGKPGLDRSGFEKQVDLSAQEPGQFHMYLAYAVGGQSYVCDNGRQVQLSKP